MKAKEVFKILKISRVTLSKYVKEGKIRVKKLPNKTYNYNDDDVYALAGVDNKRLNVIYTRVSTYKQKNDLGNQTNNVKNYMSAQGIIVDEVYSDIGSGMKLDRKEFMRLLNDVQNNKIDTVYITCKDRLARLSYELVEKLFIENSVKIKTIYNDNTIDEEELFEDLMQLIHSFPMSMYSKRRLANKLINKKENKNS